MDCLQDLAGCFSPEQWVALDALGSIGSLILNVLIAVTATVSTVCLVMWRTGKWIFKPRTKPDDTSGDTTPNDAEPSEAEKEPVHKLLTFGDVALHREVLGRADDLANLRSGLEAQGQAAVTAVVQGFGGYGKSTLARLYIQKFGKLYDGVLWAVAENEGQLASAFAPLAPHFDLNINNLTPMQVAQAVLAKMDQQGHWLLVYDNVHAMADIKALMPRNTHLIITTRESDGWGQFVQVTPGTLSCDGEGSPAARVLLQEAGRDADAGAAALARELDGLPLALVMAGSLAKLSGESFDVLRGRIGDVIAHAPKGADYPASVIGAVQVSYDRLRDTTPDACALLDVMAWWAPEGLSPDLFTGGEEGRRRALNPDWVGEDMRALADDAARLRAGFEALRAASLLVADKGGDALHRMSAAALRAMQADRGDDGAARAAVDVLAALYPAEGVFESANWPLCDRLTPHLRTLWQVGQAPEGEPMEYLLNQGAIYLSKVGDGAGELALAEASLTLTQARLPETDRKIAVGYATLGMARMSQGDFAAAERDLRKAVALRRAHHAGTVDLANSLDNLGRVLVMAARQQGAVPGQEAARCFQEALALHRRLQSKNSDKVANALNNLGLVRDAQGKTHLAALLYRASLRIRRAVLPKGDARLGFALMNTGAMLLKSGDAGGALALLQEAFDLYADLHRDRMQHENVRDTAEWLISCHIVLARGTARGNHTMKAKQLCATHGFDYEEWVVHAAQFPSAVDQVGADAPL